MANTDKQNFKCDTKTRWEPAQTKAARMRENGYSIDMTLVLNAAVLLFLAESDEETADRLKLEKGDGPAPIYRRRWPREVQA